MITLIFTFQYGYIQINQAKLFGMDPGSFTFQYGYIQIEMQWDEFKALLAFTFQPGYIQIYFSALVSHASTLYIPNWLYSNVCPYACKGS